MTYSNNRGAFELFGINDIEYGSTRIEIKHPIFASDAVGWNDLSRMYGMDSSTLCSNDLYSSHQYTTESKKFVNARDECSCSKFDTIECKSNSLIKDRQEMENIRGSIWEVKILPDVAETSDDDSVTLSETEYPTSHTELTPLAGFYLENQLIRKNVRFSTVQVREYSLTLGDHPLAGPYPLSLDWTYTEDDFVADVNEFSSRMEKNMDESESSYHFRRKPRQLDVFERRFRLAQMMGITCEQLDSLERNRNLAKNNIL